MDSDNKYSCSTWNDNGRLLLFFFSWRPNVVFILHLRSTSPNLLVSSFCGSDPRTSAKACTTRSTHPQRVLGANWSGNLRQPCRQVENLASPWPKYFPPPFCAVFTKLEFVSMANFQNCFELRETPRNHILPGVFLGGGVIPPPRSELLGPPPPDHRLTTD